MFATQEPETGVKRCVYLSGKSTRVKDTMDGFYFVPVMPVL